MAIRKIIFLLCISTSIFAQDSVKTDNLWFTEFQIANSTGFTLDLLNQADLAIGRRIFKNTDMRIVGGFNTNKNDGNGLSDGSTDNYKNTYNRYSAGIDILYRIRIVKDLLFKAGIGYEYYYTKNNSNRNYSYLGSSEQGYGTEQSEIKSYENRFKAIGSFNYSFTNNIYLFVQLYLIYGNSHGTDHQSSYRNFSGNVFNNSYSTDYQNDSFGTDNLMLGGGISF